MKDRYMKKIWEMYKKAESRGLLLDHEGGRPLARPPPLGAYPYLRGAPLCHPVLALFAASDDIVLDNLA
ncbi:hypothetical protein HPP92_024746 [Vanilla planifolia]|uniref:Uncharacterized protein n=1 Tax=Vanilla planifolia TaxID=51239 RepID=A0A835UA77_VANPL|nr:hypothetical protein HPP92_024746 [Vanilla planifolia]